MTFDAKEKPVTKKLREFEIADLEEYCKQHGINGLQKEKFIENSMKSIVSTENGDAK
jgi:hypothetical protein